MRPRLRRLALTAHVVSSVGWLGAIVVFLALALAALAVEDPRTVRAAYLAMDLTAWSVLVPLAGAALVTGVIQGIGTKWGLLRHYWVVAKLLLTVVATFVLLMYTQTIGALADRAKGSGAVDELRDVSPALHAGAAVVVLLAATVLAVFKPAGLTRYGWRKEAPRTRPRA